VVIELPVNGVGAHRAAVFLDRDGVLSRAVVEDGQPRTPLRAADFELLAGVGDCCRSLGAAGYLLVVVTNQPDIARGLLPTDELEAMHAGLRAQIPVDDIRVCPHDDRDRCGCRKPAPGMLLQAARDLGIDLDGSVMVGDRWRDIEAGRRAGCRTVLVDHGWRERAPEGGDAVAPDLAGAVAWILDRANWASREGAA
jgi:D-glycero-D-manno-heptose 1,7-bisphosphate phosphatase